MGSRLDEDAETQEGLADLSEAMAVAAAEAEERKALYGYNPDDDPYDAEHAELTDRIWAAIAKGEDVGQVLLMHPDADSGECDDVYLGED